MARGRMLNTTIATDQRLNSLSIEAEYLFLKTIPHLDRDGLIHGKANLLWAKVCPERMDLLPRIDELVDEWVAKSLVMKYNTQEGPVLFFYGFTKNQGGLRYNREAPSQFDPPPGYVRTDEGLHFLTETPDGEPVNAWSDDELGLDTEQISTEPDTEPLRTNSGLAPDEVPTNIKEIKRRESNTTGAPYPSLEEIGNGAFEQHKEKSMQRKRVYVYTDGYKPEMEDCFSEVARIYKVEKSLELEEKVGECRVAEQMQKITAQLWYGGYDTPDKIKELGERYFKEDDFGKKGSTPRGNQLVDFVSKIQSEPKKQRKRYKAAEGDM